MRRWTVDPGGLASDEVLIDAPTAKHIRRVLRLQDGAEVELRDGAGAGARARLADGGRRFVIEARHCDRKEAAGRLHLAQAVGKADKMDEVVRSAAELGVARLVPFLSARTVARKEKAILRWRRLAEDALRVSGRWFRMAVEEVQSFEAVLRLEAPRRLVAAPGGQMTVPELLRAPPPERVAVVIGPEGGFEAEELAALRSAGFEGLDLGEPILRTQTAGHAVVAALTLGWGLVETR